MGGAADRILGACLLVVRFLTAIAACEDGEATEVAAKCDREGSLVAYWRLRLAERERR